MAEPAIEPQAPLAAPAEPEHEPVAADTVEASEETPPEDTDRKRKHDELEGGGVENGAPVEGVVVEETNGVGDAEVCAEEKVEARVQVVAEADSVGGDAKRQRIDPETEGLVPAENLQVQTNDSSAVANGQVALEEHGGQYVEHDSEKPPVHQLQNASFVEPQITDAFSTVSRKVEIPNARVGVLIGKAGETIRTLQFSTGAKIQIQRDVECDLNTGIRTVELIGSADSVNKAEQLIKDVLSEADSGGSPALVARGFGALLSGAEQLELKIPNEKVGMIIGKGGETIKNLQTRSGSRIQLIPQHLPDGDSSKERTVRISGNKKQIEAATDMIKEVMSQGPGRPSSFSRSHGYRPHGPAASQQWGGRPPMQPGAGYDYQQRGPYQSQPPHYPHSYGGYTQQQQHHQPPRGNFGTGWEQRPAQAPPQPGYNYYGQGQGVPPVDVQQSGPPMTSGVGGTAPASGNYYGQQQNSGYGQPTQYAQPAPTQPSYAQGYGEPRYDAQAPTQQAYGQQPANTQPVQYQGAPQAGYQQPYNRPVYAGPPTQVQPQAYGPPAGNQPDQLYQGQYQGQNPAQNYSAGVPQQYPYGSGVPQAYAGTPGSQDGYMQQPTGGYPQYGAPASGYAQPGQVAQTYQQGGQPTYGQYPQPQQQVYSEQQPVQGNAGYGYQAAPASAGYSAPTSGYVQAPAPAGYAQAPANPTSYDQSAASQPAYAAPPAGAQAAYTKSLSPQPQAQPQAQQPGYVQYDTTQTQVYSHN